MVERTSAVEDKRRQLLDAAVRVFARKGFHASRVGDIAEEAGVAHGLLYHYSRMLQSVPEIRAPILALQGGADQAISHEDNVEFEQALRAAGKDYELIEFEGAPHSFFDRKQAEFQAASDDAWQRTLDFIAKSTPRK